MDVIHYLEQTKGIVFTDQQKKVISHVDGANLTLAVPGAGKTTCLVARTANLILSHGIPSSSILTLTFSRPSARDMKDRFDSLFGELAKEKNLDVRFSTIHSFAYGVVNRYHKYNELIDSNNASVTKAQLIKKVYRDITGAYVEEDAYDEISTAISYVKNKMININSLNANEIKDISRESKFKEIYNRYESIKKNKGFIDFDDMLSICYEVLKKNDRILNYFRETYQYIQLDEAQDTSTIQFAIVELMARPKNNLFLLGDTNQSILSFRASDINYLLNFGNNFPDGSIYFMQKNFRSTKDIVELSNEFIKNNTERYDIDMVTDKNHQRPVTIVKLDDGNSEIEYVVEKIKESNGYSKNAVLFRNNLSCVPLVEKFRKESIPFYVKDHDNKFFSHWVVSDILAFIDLALDPNDFDSLSRIYYKTRLYINKGTIYDSIKKNDGSGCLNALLRLSSLTDSQRINVNSFKGYLILLRRAKGSGIIDLIRHDMEYGRYLENNAEKMGNSLDGLLNILYVLENLLEDCENITDVREKLSMIQSLMKSSSKNKNKDAVTLSTMHGSKGLEWDNVYILSMVDGVFPSSQAIAKLKDGDPTLLEEERRLCYVAITRGRNYVDLCVPASLNYKSVAQSKFIRELNSILTGEDEEDPSIFAIGDSVSHKKFGVGKVIDVNSDDDIIIINFNGVVKRLLYSICETGVLE